MQEKENWPAAPSLAVPSGGTPKSFHSALRLATASKLCTLQRPRAKRSFEAFAFVTAPHGGCRAARLRSFVTVDCLPAYRTNGCSQNDFKAKPKNT